MKYAQHPLSAAFPSMPEDEFDALVQDLKENGQREAVILFEGKVLDGWHRYRACDVARVKCVTQQHDGSNPVAFVLSRNLRRRHLTASQRAAAVVAAQGWNARGANQHGASAPGAQPRGSAPGAQPPTVAELAEMAEVSPRTIEQVKTAQRAGLGEAVRDGTVSAKQAADVAKLPPKKRERAVAAIERGEKPDVKKPSSDPRAAGPEEALKARVAELEEKLAEAADEIERLSAVEQGEEAALIQRLQSELRTVKAKRDDVMRENVELRKQVKILERQVKRAA
jgi:uncharacterized coiled-coil protein SlyX